MSSIQYKNVYSNSVSHGINYFEHIIANLASNPAMVVTFIGNDGRMYPDIETTVNTIYSTAKSIIEKIDDENSKNN